MKVLHLIGLPSSAAGTVGALIYALISPFVNLFQQSGDEKPQLHRSSSSRNMHASEKSSTSSISLFVMMYQICQGGFSIYWFYQNLAHDFFVYLLMYDPSDTQVISGCVSLFAMFFATYSFFYIPEFAVIRRLVLLIYDSLHL